MRLPVFYGLANVTVARYQPASGLIERGTNVWQLMPRLATIAMIR